MSTRFFWCAGRPVEGRDVRERAPHEAQQRAEHARPEHQRAEERAGSANERTHALLGQRREAPGEDALASLQGGKPKERSHGGNRDVGREVAQRAVEAQRNTYGEYHGEVEAGRRLHTYEQSKRDRPEGARRGELSAAEALPSAPELLAERRLVRQFVHSLTTVDRRARFERNSQTDKADEKRLLAQPAPHGFSHGCC